jgi:hypothetical protein
VVFCASLEQGKRDPSSGVRIQQFESVVEAVPVLPNLRQPLDFRVIVLAAARSFLRKVTLSSSEVVRLLTHWFVGSKRGLAHARPVHLLLLQINFFQHFVNKYN